MSPALEDPRDLAHEDEIDRIDGFYDLAFEFDCGEDLECYCAVCMPIDCDPAPAEPLRVLLAALLAP